MVYPDGFGYALPEITGSERIPFNKYKCIYSEIECGGIVLVGLNRMINPANRCEMIHEYLTTLTPNIPKFSIDTAPFIGEPWRLFWHYLYTNTGNWGENYSYPVEREWLKWFYRERNDCSLSGDNIKLLISDTYSDLDMLETSFEFEEPSELELAWYEEARNFIFKKYDTPKLILNNLLKECNKRMQINISFDSYRKHGKYVLPDLKVYRFLAEENQRRMAIYNAVIS